MSDILFYNYWPHTTKQTDRLALPPYYRFKDLDLEKEKPITIQDKGFFPRFDYTKHGDPVCSVLFTEEDGFAHPVNGLPSLKITKTPIYHVSGSTLSNEIFMAEKSSSKHLQGSARFDWFEKKRKRIYGKLREWMTVAAVLTGSTPQETAIEFVGGWFKDPAYDHYGNFMFYTDTGLSAPFLGNLALDAGPSNWLDIIIPTGTGLIPGLPDNTTTRQLIPMCLL